MAVALAFMAVRRIISFLHLLTGDGIHVDPTAETVALMISFLMLGGVASIGPIFSALNRNIAERKDAEESLKASEHKFRELFNNMNEAVFFHEVMTEDKPGKFVEVNDIACRRLGYTREELLRMNVADINAPSVTQKDVSAQLETLKSEWEYSFESEHIRKDRSVFPVHINARIIEMWGHHYILSLVHDITREKEIRRREGVALKQIEENLTQLSILNHQIRNPLAVIVGLVDLEDMDVSDKILEQTEEIDKTISRLDKGWLESAKIQEFLRKHYDVGDYEGNDDE